MTHMGVKPYGGTMCDKRFYQRHHLARHSVTHMGMSLRLLVKCLHVRFDNQNVHNSISPKDKGLLLPDDVISSCDVFCYFGENNYTDCSITRTSIACGFRSLPNSLLVSTRDYFN